MNLFFGRVVGVAASATPSSGSPTDFLLVERVVAIEGGLVLVRCYLWTSRARVYARGDRNRRVWAKLL